VIELGGVLEPHADGESHIALIQLANNVLISGRHGLSVSVVVVINSLLAQARN
jgi:hypothetical protein